MKIEIKKTPRLVAAKAAEADAQRALTLAEQEAKSAYIEANACRFCRPRPQRPYPCAMGQAMSILDITLTAIDTETTGLDTATAQVWELNRFGHEMPEASRAAFEDAARGR